MGDIETESQRKKKSGGESKKDLSRKIERQINR